MSHSSGLVAHLPIRTRKIDFGKNRVTFGVIWVIKNWSLPFSIKTSIVSFNKKEVFFDWHLPFFSLEKLFHRISGLFRSKLNLLAVSLNLFALRSELRAFLSKVTAFWYKLRAFLFNRRPFFNTLKAGKGIRHKNNLPGTIFINFLVSSFIPDNASLARTVHGFIYIPHPPFSTYRNQAVDRVTLKS